MALLLDRKIERRIGLTKENIYAKLHPDAGKERTKQQGQESTEDLDKDIFKPPVTDSDEESLEEDGKQPNSSNASIRSFNAKGRDTRSLSRQSSSPPGELYNAASNIPAGRFFPSSQLENSKKRNSNMMSGDISDDDGFPKGPRRVTKMYGRHSTTFDTSPKAEKKNKGKTKVNSSSTANKKGGPVFRTVDTGPIISQVNKMQEREEKNPNLSGLDTSPRAQRALNRSRNIQNKTKDTRNVFKVPAQTPSPKAASINEDASQKFMMPLVLPDSTPNPQATRVHKSFRKPDTTITTSSMQSLLEKAQNKLDLSDIPQPPPFSSITASSLPSTVDDADSSSTVSSPPSSPEIEALIQGLPFENTNVSYFREPPAMAKCPLCKKPVERSFLETFDRGGHLNIRQQLRFCNAHRARSAGLEWEAKGYPKIDWQHLDKRLAWFHRDLDEILQGKRPSFYRNAFEDHLKSGQNRTLLKAMMSGHGMEGLVPGYYGSRGAKLISENIMTHFAPKLRRLVASDKLISSGGVSGYVQAVLAPELAVMLVMQDMGTDEEGARAVLRDSVDIGNLLNEEEDEVIKDPVPREGLVV